MKKYNFNNIWVIIQGPIKSNGRNFKTSIMSSKNKINDNLIIKFNSEKTIIKNVILLKKKGIKVIYSGWNNDCSKDFISKLNNLGCKVILSNQNDSPSSIRFFSKKNLNKKNNLININNKSKQYLSFLKRFKKINQNLNDIIILKIRSDISLSFNKLFKKIEKEKNNIMRGSIIVQYLTHKYFITLADLPDFWFIGRGDTLFKIFKDLYIKSVNNLSYSDHVHYDISLAIINHFYPCLKINYFKIEKKRDKNNVFFYKLLLFYKIFLSSIFFKILFFKKKIIPSSKELEFSIIWRGDLKKNYKDKFNSENLIFKK
jgi:hypothetical protein